MLPHRKTDQETYSVFSMGKGLSLRGEEKARLAFKVSITNLAE